LDNKKINIDQYFKNALQDVEGQADDMAFEAIQQRLKEAGKEGGSKSKYLWLLLLLFIPTCFGIKYLSDSSPSPVLTKAQQGDERRSDNSASLNVPDLHDDSKVTSGETSATQTSTTRANTSATHTYNNATRNNPERKEEAENQNGKKVNKGGTSNDGQSDKVDTTKENNTKDVSVTDQNTEINPTEEKKPESENQKPAQTPVTSSTPAPPVRGGKTYGFTIRLFGGAGRTDSYLETTPAYDGFGDAKRKFDKATRRANAGLSITKSLNGHLKGFSIGTGINYCETGQKGTYKLKKTIYDSIPDINLPGGYFYYNFRDSILADQPYNNVFTTIELPLYLSYSFKVGQCNAGIGLATSLSYLVYAGGYIPTAKADGVLALNRNTSDLNRFGANCMLSMNLNYMLSRRFEIGGELFNKINMTSLYNIKGVKELPYSMGVRFSLGYKF
jgi:hypothetical protein